MFDYNKIYRQVEDYDMGSIMNRMHEIELEDINDIDQDDLISILISNEVSEAPLNGKRHEFVVSYGTDGTGWTDGMSFDTLDRARELFDAVRSEEPDPQRHRFATLQYVVRDYSDGAIVNERLIETIEEARF